MRDEQTLRRIRALAIPPAWTDVWISPDPQTHLQATGRDARGRKQYRYHKRWRDVRHQTKFDRMVPFAQVLPHIRQHVTQDLRELTLSKRKVVAAVVQLLERALIRIGNPEYARANGSFGLTTLQDRHVRVRGAEVCFHFMGKSRIRQAVTLSDARLARIVKRCQELPGQELFQYVDGNNERRPVTSADVNEYLREVAGGDFTAKDFRTWAGTLLAAIALGDQAVATSQRKVKRVVVRAVDQVAQHLGNTPAVCRACYIHPAVLEAYADGTLAAKMSVKRRRVRGLAANEGAVLGLLETHGDWRRQLEDAARVA